MWIRSRPTTKDEERDAVRCGVIYFTAIHADLTSMREGITFVIDTTENIFSFNSCGNVSPF